MSKGILGANWRMLPPAEIGVSEPDSLPRRQTLESRPTGPRALKP